MGGFRTTRWSLVTDAAGLSAEAGAALAELCKLYWPPVHAFIRESVRRSGRDPSDALDLTQSFFELIFERKDLANADPQRGRFRAWLLGAVKHFLANEGRRGRAKKRGGGTPVLSIDEHAAEGDLTHEPADALTPEHAYARRWAHTVLDQVMCRLEHEQATAGKRERFACLKRFLDGDEPVYDELASELGEPVGTLRVQVHRLRRRYRDLLRDEIAHTVETPAEVDDELRYLLAALL